jgi:hypothetical protein
LLADVAEVTKVTGAAVPVKQLCHFGCMHAEAVVPAVMNMLPKLTMSVRMFMGERRHGMLGWRVKQGAPWRNQARLS